MPGFGVVACEVAIASCPHHKRPLFVALGIKCFRLDWQAAIQRWPKQNTQKNIAHR